MVEEGARRLPFETVAARPPQQPSRHPPLARGNGRVKEAARLSRRSVRSERRLFLADGPKAVEGALDVSGCVVEVFATAAATERYADLAGRVAAEPSVRWTLAEPRAVEGLSDSVTPAGLVAVCRFVDVPLGVAIAADRRLVTICADVRDPGNAGTVIRTSDAMGADAVVLAGSSVDAYNPKTVRASVGSLFHLPVTVAPDAAEAVGAARAAGLTVLAAGGDGELDLDAADDLLAGPVAWVFGNEAHGLSAGLAAAAHHRVRIPISGRAESLNLATAAAICLHATSRAQRAADRG